MGIEGLEHLKPDDDWSFDQIQEAYLRGGITLIQAYQMHRRSEGFPENPDPDAEILNLFRSQLWPKS